MVMSIDILLCSEGDFSSNTSDICIIHTLNDNTPKNSSLLHQLYTSQCYSEHSPQAYVSKTSDAEYMKHTSANRE